MATVHRRPAGGHVLNNDLSLLTRALIWLLNQRPDIDHIFVDPLATPDFDDINQFPESGPYYPGKGSPVDTQLKRDYLEACWERTGPPKRP